MFTGLSGLKIIPLFGLKISWVKVQLHQEKSGLQKAVYKLA